MKVDRKLALTMTIATAFIGESQLNAQTAEIVRNSVSSDLPLINDIKDRVLLEDFIFNNVENLSDASLDVLNKLIGKKNEGGLKITPSKDFGSISHGALQHDQGMSVE